MKLSDVWNRNSESSVRQMKSYIEDNTLALQLFKFKADKEPAENSALLSNSFQYIVSKFIAYSIGQVVTYVITKITDDSISMMLSLTGSKNESTVAGVAMKYTDFEELSVSHMGNAVVCDFDFDRKAVVVFMQPQPAKIVRQVRNSQKANTVKNIKVNQSIKGTVIYIGKRYVLASLSGHAPGVVAYIPSRRHENDLGQIEKLFTVGEDYHFVVKDIAHSDQVIAVLNVDNKKASKTTCSEKKEGTYLANHKPKQVPAKETKKAEPLSFLQNDEISRFVRNIHSLL